MKPKKKWKVVNKDDKNSVYQRKYDTVYESKLPFMKRALLKQNAVHQANKKILLNNPQFAGTDAQHFVQEYANEHMRKKLNKSGMQYNKQPLLFLPLREQNDGLYKDNAYYDKNSFAWNGSPASDIYPNFASVIAHEKGHQLDDVLSQPSNDIFLRTIGIPDKKFSFTYKPFVENNFQVFNSRKFGFEDTASKIINNDATAYLNGLHDAYPNEMFADLIADKYIMNTLGIYNSLLNTPFEQRHLKQYQNYLEKNGQVGGRNRLMRMLIDPNDETEGRIPSNNVYIKAMNDL